ncbi:MAG: hypothetical protein ACQEXJ_00780 [Myxococcota bacterium]
MTVALLALLLAAPRAGAGSDPSRTWYTLTTEHFAVHTYDGGEALARRAARYAEEAWRLLNPVLKWTPRERVHVLVVDERDAANGFASVMPYDSIVVWAYPPDMDSELSDYDDWLKLLMLHEYAHIAHLDNATGLPGIVNRIFGKTAKPNTALPRWVTEGVATWIESTWTQGGRVGSSRFEMVLRAAALEGDLIELEGLTGAPLEHPRSTAWYMYGGYLVDHIVRATDQDAVGHLIERYGRRSIPYGMNIMSRQTTGRDLRQWYLDWVEDVRERARATVERVEAAGRMEGRRVTTGGERKSYPEFTPDGEHLLYVHSDGRSRTELVMAPADAPDRRARIVTCEGGCGRFQPTPDGRDVLMQTGRPWRYVHFYGELRRLPLEAHQHRRAGRVVTEGARVHDPRLTADGDRVWVVRSRWGRTWLEALEPRTGRSLDRWEPPGWARVDAPLPHPDGRRLFATMHHEGNRDLVEVDLEDGSWRRLTHGASMEIDPTLTADGRWLVYSSDADGVYDVYARDVSGDPATEGRTFRLTRVVTGATQPAVSPDGGTLVYVGWTADGDELYAMPFDPEGSPQAPPGDPKPARSDPEPPSDVVVSEPTPYQALPTLLPRSWAPSFTAVSGGGTVVGLELDGVDITGRLSASLSAEYDFQRDDVAAAGRLGIGLGFPDVGLTVGRYTRDRFAFFSDRFSDYREEVFFGTADVSMGIPSVFVSMRVGAAYTVDLSRGLDTEEVVHSPDERMPFVPREGVSTSLRLSWNFSDVDSYAYSISPERGVSGGMSLRIRDPALGSHASTWDLTTRLQGWLPMPWLDDHVLSLGLRAGWAGGEPGQAGTFRLGGIPDQDLLTDLVNLTQAGAVWLRGFPQEGFTGRAFELLTTEYRLPLLRVRDGVDTLPLFARDISLAVFSDAGLVHSQPLLADTVSEARAGVGAELRMTTDLFFGNAFNFRLGYAHGFGPDGIDQFYLLMAGNP